MFVCLVYFVCCGGDKKRNVVSVYFFWLERVGIEFDLVIVVFLVFSSMEFGTW